MRRPPVTFTPGILSLSATSAMARSSFGLVMPPACAARTE